MNVRAGLAGRPRAKGKMPIGIPSLQGSIPGPAGMTTKEESPLPNQKTFNKEVVAAYEDGKHRRYGLLFAVNGGALAIGRIVVSGSESEKIVLGGLKIWMLGIAMAIFSVVMTYDIWKFGERMRLFDETLFGPPGRRVLLLIGTLLTIIGLIVGLPVGH